MSRQREWQLKQIEAGLCMYCPEEAYRRGYCKRHYEIKLERVRQYSAARKLKRQQKVVS
jgi:hypothetical protein